MKPTHFDVDHALEFINQMVSADEVVTALEMLEKFPAYYRDHPTTSMVLTRQNIMSKITTVQDYFKGEWQEIQPERIIAEYEQMPRFHYVEELVKKWNAENRVPYICEFGPGQYWLPIGLKAKGYKFTYRAITITDEHQPEAVNYLGDTMVSYGEFAQPQIFVCFEVIEHLFNLAEVYNYYCREHLNAEHVCISTPKYALGGGWKRDHAEMIAHVRTFTPTELMQFCMKYWPFMAWQYIDGAQMVAVGSRKNN